MHVWGKVYCCVSPPASVSMRFEDIVVSCGILSSFHKLVLLTRRNRLQELQKNGEIVVKLFVECIAA